MEKLYRSSKNASHQQMHKGSFIINRNTLLHVSTLLGHLQGELSFTPLKTTQYAVNSTFSLNCKVQPECNGEEISPSR
jgi:hypothetical protein